MFKCTLSFIVDFHSLSDIDLSRLVYFVLLFAGKEYDNF